MPSVSILQHIRAQKPWYTKSVEIPVLTPVPTLKEDKCVSATVLMDASALLV